MVDSHETLTLDLEIHRQPDDASCGPTCLHAVYRYFDDRIALDQLIQEVPSLAGGGTLAVTLANHALRRGYAAQLHTVNLAVFDPTWFTPRPATDLAERLQARARIRNEAKLDEAIGQYLQFLELGGELSMEDLTPALLRSFLARDRPILTGLSATFLYRSARERGTDQLSYDDIGGDPTGHFVVLSGWDPGRRRVRVADPYEEEDGDRDRIRWIGVDRVLNSILLGVLSFDGNLLVLEPPGEVS